MSEATIDINDPRVRGRKTLADAVQWAEKARFILASLAANNMTTTYAELYDLIRREFGESELPRHQANEFVQFISKVLVDVAKLNKHYEEPLLTAMVLNATSGEVGMSYRGAVRVRYGHTPVESGDHAMIERMRCFAAYREL